MQLLARTMAEQQGRLQIEPIAAAAPAVRAVA